MSSNRRVRHLAKECNKAPEDALSELQTAGFALRNTNDLLPVSGRPKALAVLRGEWKPARQSPGVAVQRQRPAPKPPAQPQPKKSRVKRLSEEDVLAVRRRMATTLIAEQDSFGATEPLWYDKFSSAVHRQFTSGAGIMKYDTVSEVAATLAFGLAMNHSFENGNKRTALVALLVLLNRNRTLLVDVAEDDLYDLITSLVKHELPLQSGEARNADTEVQAVARWIKERSRNLELGDRLMRFSEMKSVLVELECTFDKPANNFIKVRRGGYSVKMGYPRRDFEIDAAQMKRIRNALRLDEVHGLDSAGFYNLDGAVDEFVNTYRNVLRRLADM